MNKRFFKTLVRSHKGSVSVYLIVVLVPIFLFHAVLIDFARVKLSERDVDLAVKAGMRSVLAGYDLDLQPYGLFALKEEGNLSKMLFGNIINQNISTSHPGEYVHLLDQQLMDSSLKNFYTLANQSVFRQQVLEEMKYKAPLEFTLELINKFKKPEVTNQLTAAEQFSENAEKLEELLEQRNKALDDSWSEATRFLDSAESMNTNFNEQIDNMRDHNDVELSFVEELKSQIITAYSNLSDKHHLIVQYLSKAEEKNTLLDNEKHRLLALSGSNATNREVFQAVFIYDVNYFSVYTTELSKILAAFSGLASLLDSVITADIFELWNNNSQAMVTQINGFRQEQGTKETNRQVNASKTTIKKNEQKSKLNQAVTAAKNTNQGCSLLGNDPYRNEYQKLKGTSENPNIGLYNKYRLYNANTDDVKINEQKFDLDSGEQTSKTSNLLIKQFTGMVENFRDDLYLDEYAISKFNYRTVNTDSSSTNRLLKNQEIEYILYGMDSCSGNYSAAYSEMYVMLLAIRTMEALLKPQNEMLSVGSPLLVFLAAAAQGAVEAFSDMSKLLKGEAIPILQKTPNLKMDYKDLLRIFLMLHHNEERMISRMQALIEVETGARLERKATYLQGSAVISLRLWFIPQLFKALNVVGISKCKLAVNRCEITKTVVMSY